MENLDVCPELSLVDLQNCRILEIDGLDKLSNLSSLHLAHNGITEIKNLETNVDLDTIDLSGNPITSLAGLDGLDQLEDLWMNDCKIEDWKEVEKLERMNTVLITLEYLVQCYADTVDPHTVDILRVLPSTKIPIQWTFFYF